MGATALVDDLLMALDASRLMQACGLPPDPWQRDLLGTRQPIALKWATRALEAS